MGTTMTGSHLRAVTVHGEFLATRADLWLWVMHRRLWRRAHDPTTPGQAVEIALAQLRAIEHELAARDEAPPSINGDNR